MFFFRNNYKFCAVAMPDSEKAFNTRIIDIYVVNAEEDLSGYEMSVRVQDHSTIRDIKIPIAMTFDVDDDAVEFYTIEDKRILGNDELVTDYNDKQIRAIITNKDYVVTIDNGKDVVLRYDSNVRDLKEKIGHQNTLLFHNADLLRDDDLTYYYANERLVLTVNFNTHLLVINKKQNQPRDVLPENGDVVNILSSPKIRVLKGEISRIYYDEIREETFSDILLFTYDKRTHKLVYIGEMDDDILQNIENEIICIIVDYDDVREGIQQRYNVFNNDELVAPYHVQSLIKQIEIYNYIPGNEKALIDDVNNSLFNYGVPNPAEFDYKITDINVCIHLWRYVITGRIYSQNIVIKLIKLHALKRYDITNYVNDMEPIILDETFRKQFLSTYKKDVVTNKLSNTIIPAHQRLPEFIMNQLRYQFSITSNMILTLTNELYFEITLTKDTCNSPLSTVNINVINLEKTASHSVTIKCSDIQTRLLERSSYTVYFKWNSLKDTRLIINDDMSDEFMTDISILDLKSPDNRYKVQIELINFPQHGSFPVFIDNIQFNNFNVFRQSDFTVNPTDVALDDISKDKRASAVEFKFS